MTTKYQCPFCEDKIVCNGWFNHILYKHEEEAITYNTSSDKNHKSGSNHHRLRPEYKNRADPIPLRFPDPDLETFEGEHRRPGEYYYCCFGCKKAYKRSSFGVCHKRCKEAHLQRIDALYEKYKEQPVEEVKPETSVPVEIDWTPVQKQIWRLLKNNWEKQSSLKTEEAHNNFILEHIKIKPTLTEEEYWDCQPAGLDTIYLQQATEKLPFDCSLETLIEKFEKDKRVWFERIPPKKSIPKAGGQ